VPRAGESVTPTGAIDMDVSGGPPDPVPQARTGSSRRDPRDPSIEVQDQDSQGADDAFGQVGMRPCPAPLTGPGAIIEGTPAVRAAPFATPAVRVGSHTLDESVAETQQDRRHRKENEWLSGHRRSPLSGPPGSHDGHQPSGSPSVGVAHTCRMSERIGDRNWSKGRASAPTRFGFSGQDRVT
jgi:hypothetical protein